MVDFMEANLDFLKGNFTAVEKRRSHNELRYQLIVLLNSAELAIRSEDKWRKAHLLFATYLLDCFILFYFLYECVQCIF